MYTLSDYGSMIAKSLRIDAYKNAIEKAVHPGDSVLDIGCGPGAFALLACRAGARKVYAIDSQEIMHFARELAVANGFADRMEFIQSDSRSLQLPERVNVIISDIRGSLPLYDHAIASVEDARQRLLAPGGRLIPQCDTLKAAIIEAGDFYSKLISPWRESLPSLELSLSVPLVLNGSYTSHFKPDQLLTEPQTWAVVDYLAGAKAGAAANLDFVITRAGTGHGICLWFEAQLLEGIGYSSGPAFSKTIYGQVLLPWLQAVPVQAGQRICVSLHANLVGEDYVWQWETKVRGNGNGPELHFRQSTFQGANLTPQALRRRAGDFIPTLSDEGAADRWLLHAMDGKTSLQQMAQAAAERFPSIFPRWENALHRAAELARQFSR